MNKVIFLFLFILGIVYPAFAQEVYQAHTHVRLVSEQDNVAAAGYSVMVGFDFILDDGWHMYWKNPGDSGLAPKIKWDLPDSVKAGGIVQWPYPERINVGPLTSYGYEHELLLLVPILVDGQYQASKPVNLHATVNWLTCKDICIPGKAEFNLSLPMVSGVGSVKYNHFKNVFNETRQKWPELSTETSARAVLEGNQWHLLVQSPYKNHGEVFFYPFRDDVIEHSALQRLKMTPDGYELYLTKSHLSQGILKSLDGVLVNSAGWFYPKMKAIEIHAPIELAPLRISFILACLFAFIGGLILNLMPCVLPVLSIKVLHLIERHPDRSIALRHSLMYALGILVSVWSLALLLFILKSAGQFAGWGFQFQSPVFVIIVALILFVLALNLFGVFEFTVPAINGLPSK